MKNRCHAKASLSDRISVFGVNDEGHDRHDGHSDACYRQCRPNRLWQELPGNVSL